MKSQQETQAIILEAITKVFREYPATVEQSAEDQNVFCVRVYAVPENVVDEVEDLILDLQERISTDAEYILLPMVKNLEVTKEYYPEYLPDMATQYDADFTRIYDMFESFISSQSEKVYGISTINNASMQMEFQVDHFMIDSYDPARSFRAMRTAEFLWPSDSKPEAVATDELAMAA